MKSKINRISIFRKGNKRLIISPHNFVPQRNSGACCHASEHVSIEVVVEGQSYIIEISNEKINEVFVKAFPNL